MAAPRAFPRLSPRAAGRAAGALLLGVGAFQVALALGAPWGRAAWGGAHPGQLPPELRVASAVSLTVYGVLAVAAGSDLLPPVARRRILVAAGVLMGVGSAMNLASPSVLERVLWTPVTVALVLLLWRASRTVDLSPAPEPVGSIGR